MGWHLRAISITLLMVLALLPVSATVCAITCDGAAHSDSPAHHHGAAQEANASAAADVPLISGSSAHPCQLDVAIQHAATAVERTPIASSAPPATLVAAALATLPAERSRPPHGAPPGSTPSTSAPLVLRI